MYENYSGFELSVEGTILHEFIHTKVLDTVVDLVSITWWTPEKLNILFIFNNLFFKKKFLSS